ncbi:hypothetical protein L9F63_007258, partial [Diploptera punctata]
FFLFYFNLFLFNLLVFLVILITFLLFYCIHFLCLYLNHFTTFQCPLCLFMVIKLESVMMLDSYEFVKIVKCMSGLKRLYYLQYSTLQKMQLHLFYLSISIHAIIIVSYLTRCPTFKTIMFL